MSRLEELQRKRFKQKMYLSLGFLVVLIIFLATFGIRTIINTTLFVTNLTSSKSTAPTSTNGEPKLGVLDIDAIPLATNSARIIVSGTVSGYDTVAFYINSSKVKEKKLDGEDFSEEIGDLQKGANSIVVKASSESSKDERKSDPYPVMYRADKPKLDVSEPQDNVKTANSDVSVSGKTDKDILIKVNDMPVVVDAQGNFHTSVRLKDGDNTITVSAIDDAGNTETKTLHVNYQKDS